MDRHQEREGVDVVPYQADHEESCEDKSRYIINRVKIEVVNSKGSILDNSDPGWVMSTRCGGCNALAKWVDGR